MITTSGRRARILTLLGAGLALLIAALAPTAQSPGDHRPTDPIAAADALLARGEAQAALRLLEKAAEARRGDPAALVPALRLEGYALVVLRRETDAERVFRELLVVAPGDDYATLELAKRLHARAAWDEARALYRALLARRPDHPSAAADLERMEADARQHAGVADRIAVGRQRVWILAGVTLLLLALFGWLVVRFLRRPAPAGS